MAEKTIATLIDLAPRKFAWDCDYHTCVERGNIMGVLCQSTNFASCPYYDAEVVVQERRSLPELRAALQMIISKWEKPYINLRKGKDTIGIAEIQEAVNFLIKPSTQVN